MILQCIFALSLGLLVNAVPPVRLSHSGYEVISFAGQKNDDSDSSRIPRNFGKMSGFKILEITRPSDDFESSLPRQDRKIHYENGRSNPKQNAVESLFKDHPSSYPTKFAFRTSDQDQGDALSRNHQDKIIGIGQSKNIDPKHQNPLIKNNTDKNDPTMLDSDFDYSDIHTEDTKRDRPIILTEDPQRDDRDKQDKPETSKQQLPKIMNFLPGPRGFLTVQKSPSMISPIHPAGHDVTSHRSTHKIFPSITSGRSRSQDDSITRNKYFPSVQDDVEPSRETQRQRAATEKNKKFLLLNSLKHFLLENKMPLPHSLTTPQFISFSKSIPVSTSSPTKHPYYPSITSSELHTLPAIISPMELSISRRVQHRNDDSESKYVSGTNEISKGSLIIDIVHESTSDDFVDPYESRTEKDNSNKTKDPCPIKGKNEFYDFLTKFGSNLMETALRYETSYRHRINIE